MKCPLCDTANDDLADVCVQCQMPLFVRECPACDALVDKSANRCPKCGGPLSPVAGHNRLTMDRLVVSPEVPAAARQSRSAPPGETQRMDRLAMRIKQFEGELAASRVAATPLQRAPAVVSIAAPIRMRQRKPEPAQSGTASWLILGGLLIAVVGGFLYQFQDPIRRQLEVLTTSPAKVSGKPAVATDPAPLRPATTPTAALASAEEIASTLAAQAETSDRAGAAPREVVLPAADAELPEKAAAAPAPVPNADPLQPATATATVMATVPEADKPVQYPQIMPVQTQAHPSAEEEAAIPVAAAAPASAPEPSVVPAPNPRPATAYDCSSAAVAALGLCRATQ